jgi:DNA-binding protein H-NS
MLTPEQEAIVRSVRKLVEFWQITPRELGGVNAPPRKTAQAAKPQPILPKYRHPRSGETWDGEGSQPPWLREALTKQGYTVEELRIDSRLNREALQGL